MISNKKQRPTIPIFLTGLMGLILLGLIGIVSPAAAQPSQGTTSPIQNGSFESGAWTPWQTFGNPLLDNEVFHGGAWSTQLGNNNGANDWILQTVTVPADATEVTMSFWYGLSTDETEAGFDYFCTGLWPEDQGDAYVLDCVDIAEAVYVNWKEYDYSLTSSELASVAGQTIRYGFVVQTDAELRSRAWVDDVELNITTPAASPTQTPTATPTTIATSTATATPPSSQPKYTVYLPSVIGSPGKTGAPIIKSFSANPASIAPDGTTTLSWDVTGATSLSISPDIGPVVGSSITVKLATTTEYTLTATNAAGTTTAKTKVTVSGTDPTAGFFIPGIPNIDRPTSHPTVKVDATGGVHIAFAPDTSTPEDETRPAYYAYCPSNCTTSAAFTLVPLQDHVEYANLALDPAGHPHLLLRLRRPSDMNFEYQYGVCDSNCTNANQWLFTSVASAYPRPVGWGEPFSRFFALDHEGHPRFVYYDAGADQNDTHWGAFYMSCDSDCTDATNWIEARLLEDPKASEFALAFTPTGQPRLAYTSYDNDANISYVAYAECDIDCTNVTNWFNARLADTVFASVSEFATLALRLDTEGKPRVALYPGTGEGGTLTPNYLHYLWCDAASCTESNTWHALNLKLPDRHGEDGVDLAFDSQNRPRIAYHAPLAAGHGLYYAWCNTNCESSAQGWQYKEIEPSHLVNQELPIPPDPGCDFPLCNPPIPPCTLSSWNNGFRPSLALDTAGRPHIAYDAEHEQGGGCGTYTDTRLTRFTLFNQP